LHDALDDTTLAGSISTFKNNDNLELIKLYPFL
jgi:hypothetical protein